MTRLTWARLVALIGYGGLWLLLPAWYLWLAPSETLPSYFIAVLLVPLSFALPGFIRDKTYTYAWSAFLSLLYFLHGVGEAWTWPEERLYAGLEIVFSLMWFTGATLLVRFRARTGTAPSA